jgi:alpha-D-ribose 1-methylphosphonate 5-triphosphate synthase subunit PhnI
MAYVAVTGGTEAIEASVELLKYYRSGGEKDLDVATLRDSLRLLIDRVMGEAGLYAPDYAAIALKQCEGSVDEAVFLLRAYRSTLPRNHYANCLDGSSMRLVRRISSAFKDIPGGQTLGPTYDYTHRFIDFSVAQEDAGARAGWRRGCLESAGEMEPAAGCRRVGELLREEGLMAPHEEDDAKPFDVTQHMLPFPSPRSARLQTLARADTGYISGLAYASLRGYSSVHPTVGELRCGWAEVTVPYLFDGGESLWVGEILMTEVESFVPSHEETGGAFDRLNISIGYGAVMGRCENKAIAMSILDSSLDTEGNAPTQDEEFVLTHGDSLEMNGFISHLKLPHYVTFQSKLDRVRGNNKTLTPQPPPPEDWGRGQG